MNATTTEMPATDSTNEKTPEKSEVSQNMAEGVGFEPTVALRLLLISSQMPLTTQPPFLRLDFIGKKTLFRNLLSLHRTS